MTKISWNDYRWRQKYITLAAFADLPEGMRERKNDYKPTFTILDYDHDGLYSIEKLFLEHYEDPTEYSFVEDVFEGDVTHWEIFKNSSIINKYYIKWKKKAEAILLSKAMTKIVDTAFDETNKNSFAALKYLVERNGKTDKKSVGRPKKEKTTDDIDSSSLLEDIKRLRQ